MTFSQGFLSEGVSRSTGIAAASLSHRCHLASDEIDNSSLRDEYLDLFLVATLPTPSARRYLYAYLLYAINGTDYEYGVPGTNDGAHAADPPPAEENQIGTIDLRAVADEQKGSIENIPLLPYKYKIVLYNGCRLVDASGVTLTAWGRAGESSSGS